MCITGWLKLLICIIIFNEYYIKVESLCFQQIHSLKTLVAAMAEPQGPFLTLPPYHTELQRIKVGVLLEEKGDTWDSEQDVL